MNTANTFKAGHRLRVEISSSNFPRFARNMNSMEPHWEQETPTVARNAVHYGADYPSRIVLDVIPGAR